MAKLSPAILLALASAAQFGWAADIAAPTRDRYPGLIEIHVDATDIDHRIVSVEETIPVKAGPMVLLYPEWGPGYHAPIRNMTQFAGLKLSANGKTIAWTRDPQAMGAFHLTIPNGVAQIRAEFQYLTPIPPARGLQEITNNIVKLQFTSLVLYPAGFKTDGIQTVASVRLPVGWGLASSLEPADSKGDLTIYRTVDLTTLFDSPLIAGHYFKRFDLDPESSHPVRFDVFGDRPEYLDPGVEAIASLRELIQQAYKIFGPPPYNHYDFLIGVSDWLGDPELEHLRSTEISHTPKEFKQLTTSGIRNYAEPHEFVHAWNGKFRRPIDLSTANLNVPMENSLLWVYEGQTQYWGEILETRSRFRSIATERDRLAAAFSPLLAARAGRQWRDLQDTLNQEIITDRSSTNWPSWQRGIDYYNEGTLIWLGIDSKIRALSGGSKSLDDFAAAFFDARKSQRVPLTYNLQDVVEALNAVAPYDWLTHIRNRLTAHDDHGLLDDLAASGWRLNYTSQRNPVEDETNDGQCNAYWSIGVSVGKEDVISAVNWNSPAFKAGLRVGGTVLAVNGRTYSCDALESEIAAQKNHDAPIVLIVRSEDLVETTSVTYSGDVRHPHLERIDSVPDRLTAILSAR